MPVSVPKLGTSFYPYLHREQSFGADPLDLGSADTIAAIEQSVNEAYQPGKVDWPTFVLGLTKIGGDIAANIIREKQKVTTDAADAKRLSTLLDNLQSGRPLREGLDIGTIAPWAIGGAVALLALIIIMRGKRGRRR
jgi:hypothetical protein